MSIFSLFPINFPTTVEAIEAILLSTSSSRIAITQDPFFQARKNLNWREGRLTRGFNTKMRQPFHQKNPISVYLGWQNKFFLTSTLFPWVPIPILHHISNLYYPLTLRKPSFIPSFWFPPPCGFQPRIGFKFWKGTLRHIAPTDNVINSGDF